MQKNPLQVFEKNLLPHKVFKHSLFTTALTKFVEYFILKFIIENDREWRLIGEFTWEDIFNFKIKFKNFIQKAKGTFYNFIMVHILLITCSVFQA